MLDEESSPGNQVECQLGGMPAGSSDFEEGSESSDSSLVRLSLLALALDS